MQFVNKKQYKYNLQFQGNIQFVNNAQSVNLQSIRKLRVLCCGALNELDWELYSLLTLNGHECYMYVPNNFACVYPFKNANVFRIYYKDNSPNLQETSIVKCIKDIDPDFVINRCINVADIGVVFRACKKFNKKYVVWITEQKPNENMSLEYKRAELADVVIMSSRVEYEKYKAAHKGQYVVYVPFGFVPQIHDIGGFDIKYKHDVVVWGAARYNYYSTRKHSIDLLVKPLIEKEFDVAVYGRGWQEVPYITQKYFKGEFGWDEIAIVVNSCKIVLGITSCATYGCYGGRYAKVLGMGGFLLCEYAQNMEIEFVNHQHLVWSKTADETVQLAKYYLEHSDERNYIRYNGQQLAYARYDYNKIFLPVLEEIARL